MADLVHLRRARDLMDREYARPLDVSAMARTALMSTAHFSRKFRAAYGETPYSYLMTRRIERAKAFLRSGMSVTETCFAVGCTSLGSFSSRFTEIVGETPSQYRARDHRDLEIVPSCVSMYRNPTPTSSRHGLSHRRRATGRLRTEQDRRSNRGVGTRTLLGMPVTVSAMFIPVQDPDAALGFYRDALGLEVRRRRVERRLPVGHRRRPRPGRRHRPVPAAWWSLTGRG